MAVWALVVCGTEKTFASGAENHSEAGVERTDTVASIQPGLFTKIHSDCVINVSFEPGASYSLVMEGEKKWVRNISVKTENGTLYFKRIKEKRGEDEEAVEVRITAPRLESFFSQGVGNLGLKGQMEETDLRIRIQGVSNVELKDFKVRNFEVNCSGVGNVNWDRLQCNDFRVEKSGVSNLRGNRLDCVSFYLSSSGVGDADIEQIHAQRLECFKSGIGTVRLKKIDCDVLSVTNSGLGKVVVGGKTNTAILEDKRKEGIDSKALRIKQE